ncbi:MAG: hypothetical protein CVV11_19890 [Gammaproteobacteria bacterium HGW-Gammaproteobacteria-15]|nr:MAG: hypothetical protein CVV11_19890 [Gammaproteobacteria bacterium HGW-Gammaproteobacteria-15]
MKISLFGGIALAAALAIAAAGFTLLDAKHDVALAKAEVQTLTGTVALKQEQVDVLAQAMTTTSKMVQEIKNERALVVKLHQEQMAGQQIIAEQLALNRAHVNELRQSTDEYVKAWSANHMPGAAVQLYHYAQYTGNYPDGSAEGAGLSNTTGKPANRLFASNQF